MLTVAYAMGYTKLFNEIVMSTIWREKDTTRIVWITMLALRNRHHIVEASVPGLADCARVSVEDCKVALKSLSDPDPDSRSKELDGRRIQEVDGGWWIVNGEKYRRKMSEEERREKNAIYQRNWRERKKNVSTQVDISAMSAQTEKEEKTYKETRVPVGNWLTSDDLWIELQKILPEHEVKKNVGLWIARIKENRGALYEAVCDYKDKRNKGKIRNTPAWLTQRYVHFKWVASQRQFPKSSKTDEEAQPLSVLRGCA